MEFISQQSVTLQYIQVWFTRFTSADVTIVFSLLINHLYASVCICMCMHFTHTFDKLIDVPLLNDIILFSTMNVNCDVGPPASTTISGPSLGTPDGPLDISIQVYDAFENPCLFYGNITLNSTSSTAQGLAAPSMIINGFGSRNITVFKPETITFFLMANYSFITSATPLIVSITTGEYYVKIMQLIYV